MVFLSDSGRTSGRLINSPLASQSYTAELLKESPVKLVEEIILEAYTYVRVSSRDTFVGVGGVRVELLMSGVTGLVLLRRSKLAIVVTLTAELFGFKPCNVSI